MESNTVVYASNIPTDQPAYAMIALFTADKASNFVSTGFEISGIRILCNAFLDWRRAPLTLHNATDVNVIGNYFGPPVTHDNLVPLTNEVVADLRSSDYANLLLVICLELCLWCVINHQYPEPHLAAKVCYLPKHHED